LSFKATPRPQKPMALRASGGGVGRLGVLEVVGERGLATLKGGEEVVRRRTDEDPVKGTENTDPTISVLTLIMGANNQSPSEVC